MPQPLLPKKLTAQRALLRFTAMSFVLLAVVLAVYASRLNQGPRKRADDAGGRSTVKPVDAHFFRETSLGHAILGYLRCIDFDCFTFEAEVVKVGQDAVDPLLALLRDGLPQGVARDSPGDVRPKVIRLLGAIGDARAVPHLIRIVQDRDPLVRAATVGALGKIGGDEALDAVLPSLHDSDQLVREIAAISLRRIGRSQALPALYEAARTEPLPHIRKAIYEAIRALETGKH